MNTLHTEPLAYTDEGLEKYLTEICGFRLLYRGKVRDVYKISAQYLLIVTTDRISIYDFNLTDVIPGKGEILTAITHFLRLCIRNQFCEFLTDFVPSISLQYPSFNAAYDLHQKYPNLPIERCLVVKDLSRLTDPYEMIFRNHIGGSVYNDYIKTGIVAGQKIVPGLPEWSYLDSPLFTPSTKEHGKHDQNISADVFYTSMGFQGEIFVSFLKRVYQYVYEYAKERGLLILDAKLETCLSKFMVIDELFTPDSARYVDLDNWQRFMRGEEKLNFLDKQRIREWGSNISVPHQIHPISIAKLDPEKETDREFVSKQRLPSEIVEAILKNNTTIFERLAGVGLKEYQRKYMGAK